MRSGVGGKGDRAVVKRTGRVASPYVDAARRCRSRTLRDGAPNQRRIITSISADEVKFMNPRTPAGATLEFVFKLAK